MGDNRIRLEIVALSHSVTQSHSYAVVLGEMYGARRIPIVIGSFEAQAIAVALENMQATRPLTHDLIKNMMNAFAVKLEEVEIYKLEEGIFFSKLICRGADGIVEIDSRTSDALALAARFNCPIYTHENIIHDAHELMEETALPMADVDKVSETRNSNSLNNLSTNELNEKLDAALDTEDYILAAKIRDEINRRKNT